MIIYGVIFKLDGVFNISKLYGQTNEVTTLYYWLLLRRTSYCKLSSPTASDARWISHYEYVWRHPSVDPPYSFRLVLGACNWVYDFRQLSFRRGSRSTNTSFLFFARAAAGARSNTLRWIPAAVEKFDPPDSSRVCHVDFDQRIDYPLYSAIDQR